MNKTALLVVDVQTALVNWEPFKVQELIANINELLTYCRSHNIEVVYVRHNGDKGTELETGTSGWEIYSDVAPIKEEKIVDKHFNSAFRQTELKEYLDKQGIKDIILVGMQSEYCMDVTCKVAFEYGFNVIVPEGTTTTFDNEFMKAEDINRFYVYKMWNNRYAKVMSIDEIKSR
ncbi:cysteine hydrolase [Mobilitalea sibirica]|uniref:Cysteine hydrolase n=1 Tax=Mobilitalea sibirica TaxID=1462919 RepID=A0A8J7HDE9_9FIRM|nr:cysteine hydrolase family protein [Mobilitalea sibirica]MBH1940684.1 cysteine hydrolase [Mobilitalea sibirica]